MSKLNKYLEAVEIQKAEKSEVKASRGEQFSLREINIEQLSQAFDSFLDELRDMGVSQGDIDKSKQGYIDMITKEPMLLAEVANAQLAIANGKYLDKDKASKLLNKMKKYDFTIKNPNIYNKYMKIFTTGEIDLAGDKNNMKMIGEK